MPFVFLFPGVKLLKAGDFLFRTSEPARGHHRCPKDCRQDFGNSASPVLPGPGELFKQYINNISNTFQ